MSEAHTRGDRRGRAARHAEPEWETQRDLLLRPARAAEYELIGAITVAVYVDEGFVRADSSYVAKLRDAAARAAQAELLVAELGGRVVGTVTYCRGGTPYANLADPAEAEFRMLAVTGAARGNGIGEALVRLCVDKARTAGCPTLRLSTQVEMEAAQRLYARLGFARTPERDWHPDPQAIDDPLLTYALRL